MYYGLGAPIVYAVTFYGLTTALKHKLTPWWDVFFYNNEMMEDDESGGDFGPNVP